MMPPGRYALQSMFFSGGTAIAKAGPCRYWFESRGRYSCSALASSGSESISSRSGSDGPICWHFHCQWWSLECCSGKRVGYFFGWGVSGRALSSVCCIARRCCAEIQRIGSSRVQSGLCCLGSETIWSRLSGVGGSFIGWAGWSGRYSCISGWAAKLCGEDR